MPVRTIPLSHRSHITGRQPFVPGANSVGHESTLERDFVMLCRFDRDVLGVEEQPVTIPWIDGDKRNRRYTPDYRVARAVGVEIVEVKYRDDLWAGWSTYKPMFTAARTWCASQGLQFRIMTERQIRKPILQNAKRLIPRLHDQVPADAEAHIIQVLERLGQVSLAKLIEASTGPDFSREIVLSAVWPLLARRAISVALENEITGTSKIWLPEVRS